MKDLVAISGEVADCNQYFPLLFPHTQTLKGMYYYSIREGDLF